MFSEAARLAGLKVGETLHCSLTPKVLQGYKRSCAGDVNKGLKDRGLLHTFTNHPHYTFGFPRSVPSFLLLSDKV